MNSHRRGKKKKLLGLISLGCPKNTVDSEWLLGELSRFGWEFTSNKNKASCLIVNTCGFINDAKLESEEAIEEICAVKEKHPETILIVTGCLPQRTNAHIHQNFPQIDLIIGVGSLHKLPLILEDFWNNKELNSHNNLCIPGTSFLPDSSFPRLRLTPKWYAYMKIAEGCSHECAFCAIPSIKGPHVSRPVRDLVNEAHKLVEDGVKEIILISQDTTAYGSDIGTNLRTLLKELDQIDGVQWLRLHYLYPSKIKNSLLEIIANSKHIIPYFDIPLQHVSSRLLKRMKRLDPDLDIRNLIRNIRGHFDGSLLPACIRTTFIVGFPGETDDDFEGLLEFIDEMKIDRVSAFKYSKEEGTPASTLDEEVPDWIAESRYNLLMELQQEISLTINENLIGKTMDVLLEGETDDGMKVGRSYRDSPEIDGMVIVKNIPDDLSPGTFGKVLITDAHPYDLQGIWIG